MCILKRARTTITATNTMFLAYCGTADADKIDLEDAFKRAEQANGPYDFTVKLNHKISVHARTEVTTKGNGTFRYLALL